MDVPVGVVAVRPVRDVELAVAVGSGLVARGHVVAGIPVGIAIAVVVPGGLIDRVRVDDTVAVVVDLIADFARARVDPVARVVAIRGVPHVARGLVTLADVDAHVAVGVAVCVLVPVAGVHRALVHRPVAVVIRIVADFARAGVDGGVGIVAVPVAGEYTVAVAVHRVITVAAVGIDSHSTGRGCTGVGAGGAVVTVARIFHIPRRLGAGQHGRTHIAVPVAVHVREPHVLATDGGVGVVRQLVTVVVHTVADFARARVDRGARVVAVRGVADVAHRSGTLAVESGGHVAVTVAVRVAVPVGSVRHADVDAAVAVVVEPIADLLCAGEDEVVGVHAVACAGGEAVTVGVLLVARDAAIAVVVEPVADLAGIRVDGRVGVVAVVVVVDVTLRRSAGLLVRAGVEVPVAVQVRVAVEDPADGDGRIRVVAVVCVAHPAARVERDLVRRSHDPVLGIAVTVQVHVRVPRCLAVVAITVLVDAIVDDLRSTGVDGRVGVVAVERVGADFGAEHSDVVLAVRIRGDPDGRPGVAVGIVVQVPVGDGGRAGVAVDVGVRRVCGRVVVGHALAIAGVGAVTALVVVDGVDDAAGTGGDEGDEHGALLGLVGRMPAELDLRLLWTEKNKKC